MFRRGVRPKGALEVGSLTTIRRSMFQVTMTKYQSTRRSNAMYSDRAPTAVKDALPLCLTDRKSDPMIEDMMSSIAKELKEQRGAEGATEGTIDFGAGIFRHNTRRVLQTAMEPVVDPTAPTTRSSISQASGNALQAISKTKGGRKRGGGDDDDGEEEPLSLYESVVQGDHRAAAYHLDNGNAWDLLEERSLEDGRNLIHVAAAAGQSSILSLFASRVTRQLMNAPDQHGFTPLLHAVKGGHWAATKVLLLQGSKTDVKGNDDLNAFDTAVSKQHFELITLLADHGAYLDPKRAFDSMVAKVVHLAATMRTRAKTVGREDLPEHRILSCLMDAGCSIDAQDGVTGNTALHLAAASGHHDTLVALLKEGAKTDVVNVKQETPLHMLAYEKNSSKVLLDKVNTLISFNAPLGAKDSRGWTPVHVLLNRDLGVSGAANIIQAIEEMIAAGAPMHAETNEGKTALDFVGMHPDHLKNKAQLLVVVEGATDGTMLTF